MWVGWNYSACGDGRIAVPGRHAVGIMTDEGTAPDRRSNLVENDVDDYQTSRKAWERLPPDPDAETHLGYELAEWEQVETTDGSGKRILLPADSDMVRDDAFIVADRDVLVDLPGRC